MNHIETPDWIPRKDLVEGVWYRGECRNAGVALWTGQKFLYFRHKIGEWFEEWIDHPDVDTPFDVFRPYEALHDNGGEDV